MRLIVCPLGEVGPTCAAHGPSHLLTLLSPGAEAVTVEPAPDHRLWLAVNDIAGPRDGLVAPDASMVDDLLAFSAGWTGERPLLVHCWAGISRSTAAAYAIACQHRPDLAETTLAQALRNASPMATPNPLIVALADRALGRQGRMTEAIAAIGRGRDAMVGLPFDLHLADLA